MVDTTEVTEGSHWILAETHGSDTLAFPAGQEVIVVGVHEPGVAGIGWAHHEDQDPSDAAPENVLLHTVGYLEKVLKDTVDDEGNPTLSSRGKPLQSVTFGEVVRAFTMPLGDFLSKFDPKVA